MKLKLTFRLSESPQLLPLSNRYATSGWINKVLQEKASDFVSTLKEKGYDTEQFKTFKLFTFSSFQIPRGFWKIEGDRIEVASEELSLFISFNLPETMNSYMIDLFLHRLVTIGDSISRVSMVVEQVEVIEELVEDASVYQFRTLSPIFLAKNVPGRKHKLHISPEDREYRTLFVNNLLDKYKLTCALQGKEPVSFASERIVFKANKKSIRSKREILKKGTPSETSLRAFSYSFSFRGPKQLVEQGLLSGFGAENALGFGFCELLENRSLPVVENKE